MQGYRVNYRPGWDCHGLPIELKACKNLDVKELSPLKIRTKAAQFAKKTINIQREAFKRWGCLGDCTCSAYSSLSFAIQGFLQEGDEVGLWMFLRTN